MQNELIGMNPYLHHHHSKPVAVAGATESSMGCGTARGSPKGTGDDV